jgi:hypothetical protein
MSFTSNDILFNQESVLTTSLVNIDLHQTDVISSSKQKFYKISYNKGVNVTYNAPDSTIYNTTTGGNIFLFGKVIHNNINGITDINGTYSQNAIGELVISASTGTTNGNDIYLCYLIVQVPVSGTDDKKGSMQGSLTSIYNNIVLKNDKSFNYSDSNNKKIDNNVTTINPESNGTIPTQEQGCIIYRDSVKNCIVIIFLNPITTSNSDLISFLKNLTSTSDYPFSKYPQKGIPDIYSSTATTSTTSLSKLESKKNKKPNSDDQIYIDCSPTGTTGNDVPVGSSLVNDLQGSSFVQLCTNMVLFFIITGLCYIGIPTIYKTAVVDKMNDNERIYAVWFTLLYLFIIILGLIIDGKNTGNSTQFLIAVFLSFLSLLIYVLTKDDVIDNSNFSSFEFLVFISSVFSRHMTQSTIIINCLILLFITYFLLYGLSLLTDKNGNKIIDSSDINHIAMWIGFTIIPFIIGLLVWIFPSKT